VKKVFVLLGVMLAWASAAFADDLYKVEINTADEARRLTAAQTDAIVRLNDGYLVLADTESLLRLTESGLEYRLVAANIERNQLTIDGRLDRYNINRYPVVFEQDNLRLYRVDPSEFNLLPEEAQLFSLQAARPVIDYREQHVWDVTASADLMDLETLIAMIDLDSLQSYVEYLEGFKRPAGSLPNSITRDWVAGKFADFGYDSIVIDGFVAGIGGTPTNCQNVIAYKVGTTYPNHHVIVGAHRDAVPVSPGADDNGSGTAGVLDVARILKDIETDLTMIFVLFDAEEDGLLGAYHYVDEASARGDSIVYMLNMDMLGFMNNISTATVYHGADQTYSKLWQSLADSLLGITGILSGNSGGSDHYPFTQEGYPATFIIEYNFSSVYHSALDSSTYMNFDYMTKLVKASAATAYTVAMTGGPLPSLFFDYPVGIPSVLAPAEAEAFEVTVSTGWGGELVPGNVWLSYSVDGGVVTDVLMAELASDRFEATLPASPCNSRLTFHVSAEENQGEMFYDPDPSEPFTAVVATSSTTIFADDFETDLGWTVSGDASDGQWNRGVPVGGGDRGDPPTDYDGSGSCYLTDNVDDNSDVDGGTTLLVSPTIDCSSGNVIISYARWYSNNFGSDPNNDVFNVHVSNNNGGSWVTAETVGPVVQAGGDWYESSFWVDDFVTPTGQVKVRFSAADLGAGSVVEAAVDAFTAVSYECQSPNDTDNDGILNYIDNCPLTYNPLQENFDGDEQGDACDEDDDDDGILDVSDNCRFADNPGQEDNDTDGLGNACDNCDCTYHCDLNLDELINPVDVVFAVNYVYKQQDARQQLVTTCAYENGDWDCDGLVNPVDVVYYANFVYKTIGGGPCDPCGP